MDVITTKMCNTLDEVLTKYNLIKFKLDSENMGVIESMYLNIYNMLKETERVKSEMRRNVKEGNCKEEYLIPCEIDIEGLDVLDKEILNKMINVSMDNFVFFTVSKNGEKLTTYVFKYAEVQGNSVYLKFGKVL